MEISGFEPETSICKIKVLPIKLYPLTGFLQFGIPIKLT